MKKIIALSAVAFLSTAVYANAELEAQVKQLTSKVNYLQKKVSDINKNTSNDNIKFDVDFRTSVDMLNYETLGGQEYSNDALISNRLWLNMGYAPSNDMVFKGQLAYHKAYGAAPVSRAGSFSGGQNFSVPQRGFGFDTFDWISSETLNDDKVRVREAYWLWMPKVGDLSFTASLGRRPSTNGYLANLREDDKKAKSPLGHVINMEFDGASAGVTANNILPGFMFKLCLGRGLTNAKAWANEADYTMANGMGGTSPNYIESDTGMDTVDMAGFIFVPYDDGQYAVKTTWYRGKNVPGMIGTMDIDVQADADGDGLPDGFAMTGQQWNMETIGDMDGMAISFKVDGIGDGINDFLDETTFFASYARSKSTPATRTGSMMNFSNNASAAISQLQDMQYLISMMPQMATMTPEEQGAAVASMTAQQQAIMGQLNSMPADQQAAMIAKVQEFGGLLEKMNTMDTGAMMGSDESETGSSIWLGVNMPNLTGGRFGLEYNKGDKYWRPFTYGEDTMAGSKLATRGTAIEAYWTQPLISDAFSMQVRYTSIKYDYTGSNGFFGDGGASYSMEEAKALNDAFGALGGGYDPVETAQDLRVYFRYRY